MPRADGAHRLHGVGLAWLCLLAVAGLAVLGAWFAGEPLTWNVAFWLAVAAGVSLSFHGLTWLAVRLWVRWPSSR